MVPAFLAPTAEGDAAAYHPKTLGWVHNAPAVTDGTSVWIFGGQSPFGTLGHVQRFTPATGQVAFGGPLPSARYGMSAASDGQHVYMFGGYGAAPLDAIVRYDPATQSSTTLAATLPSPRFGSAAAFDGSHIYVFGGHTGSRLLDEVIRFDPTTHTVTLVQRLPAGLDLAAAVWAGDRAYVVGGRTAEGASDMVFSFEPAAARVTLISPRLPEPRAAPAATWDGHAILVFGGAREWQAESAVFKVDPAGAALRMRVPLPDARFGAAAVFIGTSSWVVGGYASDGWRSTVVEHSALPAAPLLAVSGTAERGAITLSWTPPPADTYSALAGYRILRGTSPESLAPLADVPPGTGYLDTSVTPGATYHYRVVARTSYGEGAPSDVASALAETPTPRNLRARVSGANDVLLTWEPPVSGTVAHYRVYRGTTSGTGNLIATRPSGLTSYSDPACPALQRCHYTVSAVSLSAVEGARSAEVVAMRGVGNPRLGVGGGAVAAYQDTNNDGAPQQEETLVAAPFPLALEWSGLP